MGMDIDEADQDGVHTIWLRGEVDLSTSPQVRAVILKAVKSKKPVGVDMSAVEYMDSSGVATLVEGLKSSKKTKQEFALLRPSDAVMKVLQLARLDPLFTIRLED